MGANPEVIELDVQNLESILGRVEAALGPQNATPLRQLLTGYQQLVAALSSKNASIARLRQLIFGPKTERTRNVLGAERAGSTQDAGAASAAAAGEEGAPLISVFSTLDGPAKPSAQDGGPRRRGKGHGRHGAAEYFGCAKQVVPHERLHHGDACPCCDGGKLYGQKVPERLVRLKGQAPVGGVVYELQKLRCHLCGMVFTAERPADAVGPKYDVTAVSMIAMLRYGEGMPSNRVADLQQLIGIPLPASTQWDLVSSHADTIAPVHQHLVFQAAQGDVVYNDDTTMRVLSLMDQKARGEALREDDPDRCGIFTSGILSTCGAHKIALYFTGVKHAGENLGDVLARRAKQLALPIQMCDALSRNAPEGLRTILSNCLAHARRCFVDVLENFPDEVAFVLEMFKQVYQVDAEAKRQQLSPEARLVLHQKRSGPVMESLHQWLTEQTTEKKVEPNSSLGEAIAYMLKHWKKLTLFLRHAGAPLDNNLCEQALKRAILHRKNSLFYKTPRGASVGDLYMSLIQTCRLNHVDPFDYLTQLFRNSKEAAQTPERWMPWNYRAQVASARAGPAEDHPTLSPAAL